jgi:hypothetical protein
MADVDHNKLIKLVKQGAKHSEAAEALGVTPTQLTMLVWCDAQVEAGVWDEIASTATAVKKAKDVDGNRWELIAARTGESVATVKELYGGEAAVAKYNAGRATGNGSAQPSSRRGGSKTKTKTASSKKSGVKVVASKKGSAKKTAAGPRRARTRAERLAARNANPS